VSQLTLLVYAIGCRTFELQNVVGMISESNLGLAFISPRPIIWDVEWTSYDLRGCPKAPVCGAELFGAVCLGFGRFVNKVAISDMFPLQAARQGY
jgi:hypothetical protein